MEVTNGLLSNLVETKYMEAVLAPIASQVSQLIIECESNEGWRPSEAISQSAQTVKHVLSDLMEASKAKANLIKNQTFMSDMLNACEMLDLATDNFYSCTVSLQINPLQKDVRRAVIQAAKDVLQGTLKVLLINDWTDVRAIIDVTSKANSALQTLTMVSSMNDLVAKFKDFMEVIAVLTSLASRRQSELIHNRQREKLIMGLGVLKKAMPLLNIALKSFVKHPTSSQAKVSRDYAVKQIETGLQDIADAVSNRFTEEDYLGLEEVGLFVSKLDQLLEALTEVSRDDVSSKFEMWTQDVVAHSMTVARLCTDSHRDVIISNCQRILVQKGRMWELLPAVNNSQTGVEIREDYNEVCEGLIDELCDLERHVNMAALHLIVATFWQTTETLDRLVQAALLQAKSDTEWFSVLNDHIDVFGEHADKVCQVASLAAASSTDDRRVRCIRLCIHRLEQLDPEISAAGVACLRSGEDKLAVRHMKLLRAEWKQEFEDLLHVLDDMTDPRIFMDVSEEQLTRELNTCNGLLADNLMEEIADIFPSMAGKCRRVVQVAKQIVDNHEDPLYRNGLMVYVERLRKVVVGTGDALTRAREQPENATEKETLHRRLQRLPEGVKLVREGLSKHNHPDILSPLRQNIRQLRGKTLKEGKTNVHEFDENKENQGNVKVELENPFLSAPLPFWSPKRQKDLSRHLASLSVHEDVKARETRSSGVQCGASPDLRNKSVQTRRSHRSDQPGDEAIKGSPTLLIPAEYSLTDPVSTAMLNSKDFEKGPIHESYRHASRGGEEQLKGDDSEDTDDSPRGPVKPGSAKLSPALKPRVAAHSELPKHWQGNQLAPKTSPETVKHSEESSPIPHPIQDNVRKMKSSSLRKSQIAELKELDNPIVGVAKEMSRLSKTVERHGKTDGRKMSHSELLKTAKSLAKCGQTMIKFLQGISSHCLDKRFSQDLSYHIHHVSMATVQLDIISSVSMTSADDRSADEMLIKATKSLMSSVGAGLKSAETASVRGLQAPSDDADDYVSTFILAMQWKEKWEEQRHLEASSEDKDELGLRRVNVHNPPSLAELLLH